jgi:hypothetical protein
MSVLVVGVNTLAWANWWWGNSSYIPKDTAVWKISLSFIAFPILVGAVTFVVRAFRARDVRVLNGSSDALLAALFASIPCVLGGFAVNLIY